jgi:hypothetical protein
MNRIYLVSFIVALMVSCALPDSTHAQHQHWQRVYTGDDFTVDVNTASLIFDLQLIRAQFRTIFSKLEPVNSNSPIRYKTSVETIEFSTKRHYRYFRYFESVLLDSAGKVVQTYPPNPARDWKVFKEGGVTARLFNAARGLPPLGRWRIIGFRYADGKLSQLNEANELAQLKGTSVTLGLDATDVGTEHCSAPTLQSHPLSDKEYFLKLGISLDSIGVNGTQAIVLECGTPDWTPPRSLILSLPSGNLLMLWKGVFVEMKNTPLGKSRGLLDR